MADCQPMITPAFLKTITGADISDTAAVEDLIVIVSTLIGEEVGGCVVPSAASMKLRVVCAEYTSYVMGSGSGGGAATNLRAEQIGDYRVEYQNANKSDSFDLQILRDMLQSMHGSSTYSVNTMPTKTSSGIPYYEYFDPGYDEAADGERLGIVGSVEDLESDFSLDESVGS